MLSGVMVVVVALAVVVVLRQPRLLRGLLRMAAKVAKGV
jgi:hypothetical protein